MAIGLVTTGSDIGTDSPYGLKLQQTITSGSSITIPAGVEWVWAVVVGGGGGGGFGQGGGGGGGVTVGWAKTSTTTVCSIGAGGAGTNTSTTAGLQGGSTYLGG